jgi:hypothetical protein
MAPMIAARAEGHDLERQGVVVEDGRTVRWFLDRDDYRAVGPLV